MEIEISSGFKKQAQKAVLSILLFVFVFILMIAFGLAISLAMFSLSLVLLFSAKDYRVTLLAITIAISAVILVVFLFKFMFQKSVSVTEGMVQIYPHQHPKLFKMIKEIAVEVGTDMPKKVFISNQVNASVFYDSSFWSMIFPVKKNLIIGYGLVNLTTEQELKSVLAHEFGHFSQKTMKVGSFVYNCNRIVFNLVYENSSFEDSVNKVANFHFVLKLVVGFSVLIMRFYQFVLKGLYKIINLSHLSLSREMEFHADAVAANIVGSHVMASTLARLDLSDYADQLSQNFLTSQYKEGYKFENFYRVQSQVLMLAGQRKKMSFIDRYPIVPLNEIYTNNKSRLNIKDQWASHPTMKERIEKINDLNLVKDQESIVPANDLFSNSEELEKKLTKLYYKEHELIDLKFINQADEITLYKQYFDSITFTDDYNGYYNNHNPLAVKPEFQSISNEVSFESLFSDEIISLEKMHQILEVDYRDLQFIANEKHGIKTFDFDGVKYKTKQASELLKKLEDEKAALKSKIEIHDSLIYNFFYQKSHERNLFAEWNLIYDSFIEIDKMYDLGFELANKMEDSLSFLQEDLKIEIIQAKLKILKTKEAEFKKHLIQLEALEIYQDEILDDQKKIIRDYIENERDYLLIERWNENALNLLFSCLRAVPYVHSDLIFTAKKNLLDFQANQLK